MLFGPDLDVGALRAKPEPVWPRLEAIQPQDVDSSEMGTHQQEGAPRLGSRQQRISAVKRRK